MSLFASFPIRQPPTLHLTNWSSSRLHGPGRKLTIMARPRSWEHGDGVVSAFVPDAQLLQQVKSGVMSFDTYAATLLDEWTFRPLEWYAPGALVWGHAEGTTPVADGDTLLCACARSAPCHRRVAAPLLVRAGWRVLLDGAEVIR